MEIGSAAVKHCVVSASICAACVFSEDSTPVPLPNKLHVYSASTPVIVLPQLRPAVASPRLRCRVAFRYQCIAQSPPWWEPSGQKIALPVLTLSRTRPVLTTQPSLPATDARALARPVGGPLSRVRGHHPNPMGSRTRVKPLPFAGM